MIEEILRFRPKVWDWYQVVQASSFVEVIIWKENMIYDKNIYYVSLDFECWGKFYLENCLKYRW